MLCALTPAHIDELVNLLDALKETVSNETFLEELNRRISEADLNTAEVFKVCADYDTSDSANQEALKKVCANGGMTEETLRKLCDDADILTYEDDFWYEVMRAAADVAFNRDPFRTGELISRLRQEFLNAGVTCRETLDL